MRRLASFAIIFLVVTMIATSGASASNTITGTIRNCSSAVVSDVLVYIAAIASTGTCTSSSSPSVCLTTDVNGYYSAQFPSNPAAVKFCVIAVPEGNGWGGCVSCTADKCCGGLQPITTIGSTTVPANADNGTYTVNITLSYSGSCNTSNGQVANFGPYGICSTNGVALQWTAPADNGCTVIEYDVRYSTSAINDSNWGSASTAAGEPTPLSPGSYETFTPSSLLPCTSYYFGIKARLRNGNWSPLTSSNCASTICGDECQTCE